MLSKSYAWYTIKGLTDDCYIAALEIHAAVLGETCLYMVLQVEERVERYYG